MMSYDASPDAIGGAVSVSWHVIQRLALHDKSIAYASLAAAMGSIYTNQSRDLVIRLLRLRNPKLLGELSSQFTQIPIMWCRCRERDLACYHKIEHQ